MSIPENGSAWRVEDVGGAADCSSASLWRVGGDEVDGFLCGASLADLLSPEPAVHAVAARYAGPAAPKEACPASSRLSLPRRPHVDDSFTRPSYADRDLDKQT